MIEIEGLKREVTSMEAKRQEQEALLGEREQERNGTIYRKTTSDAKCLVRKSSAIIDLERLIDNQAGTIVYLEHRVNQVSSIVNNHFSSTKADLTFSEDEEVDEIEADMQH